MRKQAAFLIVMLTFGLVFAGAVSAQDVEVAVTDESGAPVDVACNGTNVTVEVNASAEDTAITEPWVAITVDPDTGLDVMVDEAVMWFNGAMYANDDPIWGGFFFWYEDGQVWAWDIGWIEDMIPGDEAKLHVPGVVTDLGPITVNADFMEFYPVDGQTPVLLDSDSYTFLSVCCHGPCVPMQETGAPLALAAMGLLSIIGGAVYGRIR